MLTWEDLTVGDVLWHKENKYSVMVTLVKSKNEGLDAINSHIMLGNGRWVDDDALGRTYELLGRATSR